MIVEEKTEKKLLTFNDDEDIYKQFEKKVAYINRLTGLKINPVDYKLQYELHEASMPDYMELQRKLYEMIYIKHPELEFGMSGRLKSPLSHYEKVIRKFIELIKKDNFKPVEILDDYAIKIFIFSVDYAIDKVSVDTEGIYIDSGTDEFRIDDITNETDENKNAQDAFEFVYDDSTINVLVEKDLTNISIINDIPYISAKIGNVDVNLRLDTATKYKRSHKEDLVPYCYSIQREVEEFYNSNGFDTKKRKDYIARMKESGYSSLQCSFYSEEQDLGLECQIRTQDMEKFNNQERMYGYKPNEKKLSANSLGKTPHFVLTTLFPDGVHNYAMTDSECFEYMYGITLKEYRKQIKAAIAAKSEQQEERDS